MPTRPTLAATLLGILAWVSSVLYYLSITFLSGRVAYNRRLLTVAQAYIDRSIDNNLTLELGLDLLQYRPFNVLSINIR